jgi:hypothetical protein
MKTSWLGSPTKNLGDVLPSACSKILSLTRAAMISVAAFRASGLPSRVPAKLLDRPCEAGHAPAAFHFPDPHDGRKSLNRVGHRYARRGFARCSSCAQLDRVG